MARPPPSYVPGDLLVLGSVLPGIEWPGIPPASFQAVLALLAQLERTQWWSPERLAGHQLRQARSLLHHARTTTEWYGRRLAGVDLDRLDSEAWLRIQILTRQELQANGPALESRAVPAQHGTVDTVTTSGSTGMPITVRRTGFNSVMWSTLTLREVLWHRKDTTAKLAIVRHGENAPWPKGKIAKGWGPWSGLCGPLGDVGVLDIATTIRRQLEWLAEFDPAYLLTYPTNLQHLVEESERSGIRLRSLRGVTTLSELLRQEVRDLVRQGWGVPVQDLYSAQEIGYMALQCPENEHYHVQSEATWVEVLDEAGRPCAPGQVGRVVLTPLHSFATPLVRYEIGDLAEVGPPCSCGRGLPVLSRILGRARNSLVLRDGGRRYPHFGTRVLAAKTDIVVQYQIVQTTLDDVEVRMVLARDPLEPEARLLEEHFQGVLPEYRVRIVRVAELPRSRGGKFEDVICLVKPPA